MGLFGNNFDDLKAGLGKNLLLFLVFLITPCVSVGQPLDGFHSQALAIYVRFDEEDGDLKLLRIFCGKKVNALKEVKSLNSAGIYSKIAKRSGVSGILIISGGHSRDQIGPIAQKLLSLLDRPKSHDSVLRFVKNHKITINGVEIDLLAEKVPEKK
jgi:hypothetical protein